MTCTLQCIWLSKSADSADVQALNLLNGAWKLAYTANSELLALLALNRLPGVTVGEIVQEVEGGTSVLNKVARSADMSVILAILLWLQM